MKMSTKTKNKLEEAYRYLNNAKDALKQTRKTGGFYQDNKYVRTAGDIAWKSVLFATEYLLEFFGIEYTPERKGRRITIQYYINALNKLRQKQKNSYFLNKFNTLYEVLHKSMGYDGIQDAKIIDTYINELKDYLDKIKQKTK